MGLGIRKNIGIAARKIRRKLRPAGFVLIYHRVSGLEFDPQMLSVSPAHFRQQLTLLQKHFALLPLSELASNPPLAPGKPVPVAITFDDGYFDNAELAGPILSELGIPATFFVVAGSIGSDREFWWDDLERNVLVAERDSNWTALKPATTSSQMEYLQLHSAIKKMKPKDRDAALDRLRRRSGIGISARKTHRPMSLQQLRDLAALPGMEIGAHTMNHPSLSSLDREEQLFEIRESKLQLESYLGKQITSFSYPYGGRSDFDSVTEDLVKEIGFDVVCENELGFVRRGQDPHKVPRLLVRDWGPEQLLAELENYRNAFE